MSHLAITDSRYYEHKLKVPRVFAIAGVDYTGILLTSFNPIRPWGVGGGGVDGGAFDARTNFE